MIRIDKLDSQKIPKITKIIKIPDIEEIPTDEGTIYGIKYFIYAPGKFSKIPLVIRLTAWDRSLNKFKGVEFFNVKMEAILGFDLRDDIPDELFFEFLSKLATMTKYIPPKKGQVTENYLQILEERMSGEFWQAIPGLIMILISLALMLHYYIKRKLNLREERITATKVEQSINDKLFRDQKYDEPAFKMYADLQNFIKYVALGKAPAVIICGPPGTSKTYIVRRVFYFEKLKPGIDYMIEKGGGLSVAAVYDLLYENKKNILVLDDFDTPLRNEDTINMLKAITDSYSKRILSISREKWMQSGQNQESPATPRKFEYHGKLIIITNLKRTEIDRALLSRAPAFEVNFSSIEVLKALEQMLKYINPDVDMKIKREVLDYIIDLYNKNPKIEIDFRAFKNSVDAKVGNPLYWKEMVQVITNYHN
jgi:hypothetical protein